MNLVISSPVLSLSERLKPFLFFSESPRVLSVFRSISVWRAVVRPETSHGEEEEMTLLPNVSPPKGDSAETLKPDSRDSESEKKNKRLAMAVFPADIVVEILSRLPVKPLLRFRSVSKIWCALIDSDYFIKLHLHRSIETRNHRKIILTHISNHSIVLDSLDVAEELDLPLVIDKSPLTVCSCNGLLLLWTYGDVSAIWNPSTQKCQILPPPVQTPWMSINVGFGYDAVNDDYKVLIDEYEEVITTWTNIEFRHVKVYSLKSNSWRNLKDFPYILCCSDGGVLAHGALHWFRDEDDNGAPSFRSIVAFDLATEETRLVSLPEAVCGIKACMDLVELEGCPCVVAYLRRGKYDQEFLGVWVLKDYGVGESWNKLLSYSELGVMMYFHEVFPLAYSKNGREVLLLRDHKEFIWFDLELDVVRRVEVQGLPSFVEPKVFVQSLVPLCSGEELTKRSSRYKIRRLK